MRTLHVHDSKDMIASGGRLGQKYFFSHGHVIVHVCFEIFNTAVALSCAFSDA